jgi:hypothetical protein
LCPARFALVEDVAFARSDEVVTATTGAVEGAITSGSVDPPWSEGVSTRRFS